MKAIFMSIRSTHSCNILNGLKTYEWRKSPLKTGDIVYGYVTKGKPYLYKVDDTFIVDEHDKGSWGNLLNGTVPFRFVVGEVIKVPFVEHSFAYGGYYDIQPHDLPPKSCLTIDEINKYGQGKDLYAHEITQLEIFDKPMQLSDFRKEGYTNCINTFIELNDEIACEWFYSLNKAPQSYQYVYVKGEK